MRFKSIFMGITLPMALIGPLEKICVVISVWKMFTNNDHNFIKAQDRHARLPIISENPIFFKDFGHFCESLNHRTK